MILMVQIGLFIRTTWKLSDIASGFEPAQVLTFHVGLPSSRYQGAQAIQRFVTDLTTRLRALPGVTSMGSSIGCQSPTEKRPPDSQSRVP